jgi:hypothetical protein
MGSLGVRAEPRRRRRSDIQPPRRPLLPEGTKRPTASNRHWESVDLFREACLDVRAVTGHQQVQDKIAPLIFFDAHSAYARVTHEFNRVAALDVMSLGFRH